MKKILIAFFLSFLALLPNGNNASAAMIPCPDRDQVLGNKSCLLKGGNFKGLRESVLLKCTHGHVLYDLFNDQNTVPSTKKTETIDAISPGFNNAVRQVQAAARKCNTNKFKEAEISFENAINALNKGVQDEVRRLATEGKTEEAQEFKSKIQKTAGTYKDVLDEIDLNGNLSAIPSSENIFGSGDGKILGYESKLRDYASGEAKGSEQFRTSVEIIIDYIKKAMIPIGIFLIVFAGVELFSSRGESSEETMTKKKNTVISIITGFFIFFLAVNAVDWVLFGTRGEILRNDDSVDFARRGFAEFEGMYDYLATFVTIIGVAFIVITSFRLVFSGGDESMQTNAKKHILMTVAGVAVIITLKPLLNIFLTNGRFSTPNATNVIELLAKWADYILGFVGTIGVVALVYAGIRLIIDFGNEEAVEKAKKIALYAAIGIVLAFSTWTLVNFFANPGGDGIETSFERIYQTDPVDPLDGN